MEIPRWIYTGWEVDENDKSIGFRGNLNEWAYFKITREKSTAKMKRYPAGNYRMIVCDRKIFCEPVKWLDRPQTDVFTSKPKNMKNVERSDSVKRAKEKIFDISYLNQFEYFITWTIDPYKVDRYDPVEVGKKVRIKLQHMVQRQNLRYLLIPELHKDGAIHMHGLMSGNLKLTETGKKTTSGQPIYNMADWPYGWSTAIPLYGDIQNVAKYMTKYATKDLKKIFGAFYYAGGKGLVRNPEIEYTDIDFESLDVKAYENILAGRSYKYLATDVRLHDEYGDTPTERSESVDRERDIPESGPDRPFGDDLSLYTL